MKRNILNIKADMIDDSSIDCHLKVQGDDAEISCAFASILTEIGKRNVELLKMILKEHAKEMNDYLEEIKENG